MPIKSHRPEPRTVSRWTRRGFVGAGVSLPLLAGCSSDENSASSDVLKMMGQTIDAYTGSDSITRDQAAAVPYASIGVSVGDSGQALLVLAAQFGTTCLWASAAHIAIETQFGRITHTAGLAHNMSQDSFSGGDPLQSGVRSADGAYEFAIDLPDRNIYQASVRYEMGPARAGEIVVLGAKLNVLHVRESGFCSLLDWRFENEYWADATNGFIWQSQQAIHPSLDQVTIVALRPPA
jgi:hypothetical protein